MSQFERTTSNIRNRYAVRPDLVIRPVYPDDAKDIYTIISDPMVATSGDWIPAAEFVNTRESLEKPDPEQHRLVAELEGTVVAIAWLKSQSRPRVNHIGQLELVVRPDDVNALYDIFRRPEVCRTTLQMPSQEIGLTEDRVFKPPAGIHRLVAISDEQIVGSISIVRRQSPRRSHSAGLGMMVHPDYWGQGIGTFLMESILDLADKWLNLKRIDLDVNVDNPAGIRLYEKFGFVVEGTKRYHAYGDGRWADSYFMARVK